MGLSIGIPIVVCLFLIVVGFCYFKNKYANKIDQERLHQPNRANIMGDKTKMTGHSALMMDQEDNGILPNSSE